MQTSIEEINGELFTVVWHDGNVRRFAGDWRVLNSGAVVLYSPTNRSHHIATALPALRRNPSPEDSPLLYRYLSEGIVFIFDSTLKGNSALVENICKCSIEITHATDKDGNRVEVAIKEAQNNDVSAK